MMRNWKLWEDLCEYDNLLDPVSFHELIITVHCNCKEITEKTVRSELKRIMEIRQQDLNYLLSNNIEEIIKAAKGEE